MAEFVLVPDEIVFEVMLKEPYYIVDKGTDKEVTVPMVSAMGWNRIPVKYREDCEHETTACDECADTWMMDHYIRITVPGEGVLYLSPDAPTSE